MAVGFQDVETPAATEVKLLKRAQRAKPQGLDGSDHRGSQTPSLVIQPFQNEKNN